MQRLEIAGPVLQGKLCTEEGDLEYQKVNLEIQTQNVTPQLRGIPFRSHIPPEVQARGAVRGVKGKASKIMSCRVYGSRFIVHGS
jgi:hypothetical protein